jgi:steroid 5-alpha reductase family enzyme
MKAGLVLACTFALAVAGAFAFWRASLRLRDAGIVDVYWGFGFGALALAAFALRGRPPEPRSLLLLGAALLWSARLGLHMLWRRRGRSEDFRYQALRAAHGERFAARSLYSVFLLQAGVQWLLSLTLQLPLLWPGALRLRAVDAIGAALVLVGLVCESVADWQLERFRRDPAQRGGVLARGLWRYSRHPNYFGDLLVWCGFFLIGWSTPFGVAGVLGPLLLAWLLLRVSGVPLLEQGLAARLPAYREYVRRTPAFVPGLPRGR